MMLRAFVISRMNRGVSIAMRRGRKTWRVAILFAAMFLLHLQPAQAVNIGDAAPSFALPVVGDQGGKIDSRDLRGKVVFVDFWASWCGPCRQSLPLYATLRKEITRADFVIVAINVDENLADAKRFLQEHPVDYPVVRDPQGDVPSAFGVPGMPSSYLIDRDGIVRARHVGFEPKDLATLRRQIDQLLGGQGHAKS